MSAYYSIVTHQIHVVAFNPILQTDNKDCPADGSYCCRIDNES